MTAPTTVARLLCDEKTARRIADYLGESLDANDTACAAFEDDKGQWQVAIHFREPPDEERSARPGAARRRRGGGRRADIGNGGDPRLGGRQASPASSRCAPAASWCMARMTARA